MQFFFRPFIGPEITWSVSGISLIKKKKKIWWPSLSIFVRFGIGATIRIVQEIQCLPYAGFVFAWLAYSVTQSLSHYYICRAAGGYAWARNHVIYIIYYELIWRLARSHFVSVFWFLLAGHVLCTSLWGWRRALALRGSSNSSTLFHRYRPMASD